MKKTVALLFGGKGEEHAISCRSAAAVLSHLDKKKYRVIPIGIDREGDFFFYRGDPERIGSGGFRRDTEHLIKTFPLRLGGRGGFFLDGEILSVDAVFPVLHGRGGEDGEIQGTLSAAGLPFVGCDAAASAVSFDKAYTKAVAQSLSVPTARGVCIAPSFSLDEAYRAVLKVLSPHVPWFVKPARQGSSFGASVAKGKADFAKSYDLARAYGRVLVEEYIENKTELELAFLEKEGAHLFAGPGRIASTAPLYSYDEKYKNAEAAVVGGAESTVTERVTEYAKRLTEALSLNSLARLDFFLTAEGQILFNEVNTLPGFTETSLYPRLWEAQGLSFTALLDILIGEAIARFS
ncbi:MAG: D-alanine--D-alanine ligase [Clostridia bacterium]|nr:D-alanine--D-alanine ligase [Clostridia bacterium]